MKIIIFLILIIPSILLSQNLDKIKEADTLYVYFKNDNINQIKNLANSKFKSFNYVFVLDVEKIKPRQSFSFFEDYRNSIPETKWVRKSFLKKNKIIIVNYDFFKMVGFFEAEQLLLNKKKIFLIDFDSINFFKAKIIEVKIINRNYLTPIE